MIESKKTQVASLPAVFYFFDQNFINLRSCVSKLFDFFSNVNVNF